MKKINQEKDLNIKIGLTKIIRKNNIKNLEQDQNQIQILQKKNNVNFNPV